MRHQPYRSRLITVSYPGHTTHNEENVVTGSVDTNLCRSSSTNSGGRKDKLKGGVVDSGEVATATGLVLLGAEGKGVDVDTGIGGTCVVLERLDNIEVTALTLGEAVLAVKL